MSKELMEALDALEKEKNISKESLFDAIENSLVTACKNNFGKADNVRVEVDRETCDFKLYKLFRNATITEKRLNELFTKNRISKLKLKTKEGKAYTVNVILNKQNYTLEVEKKEPKII